MPGSHGFDQLDVTSTEYTLSLDSLKLVQTAGKTGMATIASPVTGSYTVTVTYIQD
ncbi:MAG TPA: hypothetical protein VJS65_06650 [Verrucomicrobiae bacterium]|nr:hypothetical protein [Verrucomicrobiae bacterium]